ncbi:MAG: ABC transporter substrate-binding protein [Butyrivibrio sp.]|nr:ABC transporter substrate-binding protein [Butyrivibrio sp.]
MRRISKALAVGLTTSMIFMCAACGGNKTTTEPASEPAAEHAAETAETTATETDAAQEDVGAEDGLLRLAINADIVIMDAHKTTNDYIVPMNIFDTLFKVVKASDGSSSIEKSLVQDYDVSEDGLTYNFTLREGVVFSDGTPLTADDVKFTFERMLTLPDSEQTDYGISIEGADALMEGKADELTGIKVEDDTHFSITLMEPFAGFLAMLATPSTVIYSRSIVTSAGDDFGIVPEKTIGSGPYIVTEWERGAGLKFEYNPLYWGEEPSVKKVSIRVMDASSMDMAFQKGDLDIIDCLMIDSAVVDSTYKTQYKDNIVSVDRLGLNYLMLNEKIEPLNDPKVRKAIQMAIDRESILQSIYGGDGKIEDGAYPSGCLGYSQANQGWLKYDPDGAKKLLEEAGYPDGFDMEISLDSDGTDAAKNVVQIMAQNLQDAGINATIKNYDHASWLELRNSGEMPSFLAKWLLDYNDPDNIIYTFFGSKDNTVIRSNNYTDTDVMNRIAAARGIINEKERMAEYADLEKKLVQDDAVWVPLFSLKHLYVKSDRVAEFTPHWAGWSDIYFTGVTLK